MISNNAHLNGGNTVLLFGPQALSFQQDDFDRLRSSILNDPENHWVVNAVAELPTYWKSFAEKFPKLEVVPGEKLLEDLINALNTGQLNHEASELPNVLLSPLVIITQLTEYTKYLKFRYSDREQDPHANRSLKTETVGYCTGILSALAVSSASSKAQFEQYGAVALRLAVLISGMVDAQDLADKDKSTALATIWSSEESRQELNKILESFPQAYISVLHDENRATITTSKSVASMLQQQLKAAGIIATEIGLRGRFHCKCYQDDMEALIKYCDTVPELQFPEPSGLGFPTWSNSAGIASEGRLHHLALSSILVEQSKWYQTFAAIQSTRLGEKEDLVVCFGPERCIPPSLLRGISQQTVLMTKIDEARSRLSEHKKRSIRYPQGFSENDIAVVGMSIKVAGADDVGEFWELLCKGQSQHVEVPKERFGFETHWRDVDPKRKWYGNFIKDHDAFDHKFFKKTPREASSQDPQQRLILQAAYQAVEQSGYFNSPSVDKHIGCYLGVCSVDYENNIACHPANAFSATGTLRSFIAGKVSHYFGWTGPGLTLDTACSASAVAIHQACRAILGGECTAALAGGTMVMSSPLLFQNLAGASFLSPTGPCKPFDAKADGYCRGEGIAAVFLKKMSQAVADGDVIQGCIAATAVYQNENCTPIVVPNAPSLSTLFTDVVRKAGLQPNQVSVVEAHGTGTAVGDPAEYESIKKVFGGPIRSVPMPIGSVKGLVGHTESVSGAVALIKILLMIQEAAIPPQASFQTLNPHIKASPSDMMEVVTRLKTWDTEEIRAALINNYGASGSNASLVVTQPLQHEGAGLSSIHSTGIKHPFWITGFDERSIQQYAVKLMHFIRSRTVSAKNLSLANLAFNSSRQSNRGLSKGLIFGCSSIQELEDNLSAFINKESSMVVTSRKPERPVILCFGGQISTFVGLDQNVYDSVGILRAHLDECNSILEANGLDSFYPEIFQKSPIEDIVKLQTALFALQYSVAKAWLDCGIQVAAIVGHSFGELSGLCVSGVLSVADTIKAIAARAKLVRDNWGNDRGAMMVATNANLEDVQRLLSESNKTLGDEKPANIACFNGPKSFTLAGSVKSIDALEATISTNSAFSTMKMKKISVTNAFHSSLVEPLMSELGRLGQGLTFKEAKIPLERATEFETVDGLSPTFFAEHMRQPVYFNHAVQRLLKKYPSSIWLEAGSNSTITMMAGRALDSPSDSHFQSVNITSNNGMQNLADIHVSLWKEGLNSSFWAYHSSQTYEFAPLLLPPYQFEKTKHWLELKKPQVATVQVVSQAPLQPEELPAGLFTFVGYQDSKQRAARFRINTMSKKYEDLVSGHFLAETAPICPATVQIDMAIEALLSLHPDFTAANMQPQIRNIDNQAPICVDPSRAVWMDLVALDDYTWELAMFSTSSTGSAKIDHVSGKLKLYAADDPELLTEFAKYERLFQHQHCLDLLEDLDADDVIQGRNIYKTFAPVVDYAEPYRGLQKLVGKDSSSAGRVRKEYTKETWLDALLSDCFCQVGGIWVNCMTDLSPKEMYIANRVEQWIRSPKLGNQDPRPEVWDVFARNHRLSDKAYVTDIFVFDASNGSLLEIILGINYAKVTKHAMSKMLNRLTAGSQASQVAALPSQPAKIEVAATVLPTPLTAAKLSGIPKPKKTKKTKKVKEQSRGPEIQAGVRAMLAELVGLEPEEIKETTELADIGIDSLMGMELAHEIEGKFGCTLPAEELVEITTLAELVKCVQSVLQPVDASPSSEDDDDDDSDEVFSDSDKPSTSTSTIDTPPESSITSSAAKVDLEKYLIEFLGIEDRIPFDMLLRDLGIDSLLSTELLSDLAEKFDVHFPDDIVLEELTVQDLDVRINGNSGDTLRAGSTKPKVTDIPVEEAPQVITNASESHDGNLKIPPATIIEAFEETKKLTDQFIADCRFVDYLNTVNPKQTEMCVALIVEAFEQLGCSLRSASAGQKIERIKYLPQHGRLVEYLYKVLETDARLIDIEGDQVTRTAISPPSKSSKDLLQILLRNNPDHDVASKLSFLTGSQLAAVLSGKTDGIKIIFGSAEGRELVSGLYGEWPLNTTYYRQMEEFIKRLASKLPLNQGPLKILEMGAGTGGTTKILVPALAKLNIPIEYTFTDLSMSFVAAARKKYKQYPFMKFRTHDIEKVPADDLLDTQHIIIASNAVHATHSLTESTKNMRKALRSDGFLMMLEMTSTVIWIDIIFGLLEGWWLFDDGRRHAIAHQTRWERDLQSVGFGHVDWTDGNRPEVEIERIIIALASGPRYERLKLPPNTPKSEVTDCATRQAVVNQYVRKNIQGFTGPKSSPQNFPPAGSTRCILITGATGSLGAHCVAHFAKLPNVKEIVCLNRHSATAPEVRQQRAFDTRGIDIGESARLKLKVFGTDSSKPNLGLPLDTYKGLTSSVTDILHNAWPMSAARPVKGFESQFQVMRNLIDFAVECSSTQISQVSFQLVSSIATVGHYPIRTGRQNVPEERMAIEYVLPNGYGDAKFVCERMLDETLHKYPENFRTMIVRPGQIAGSSTSGFWNPQEHLPFLIKSAQTLKALPSFSGPLSWTVSTMLPLLPVIFLWRTTTHIRSTTLTIQCASPGVIHFYG